MWIRSTLIVACVKVLVLVSALGCDIRTYDIDQSEVVEPEIEANEDADVGSSDTSTSDEGAETAPAEFDEGPTIPSTPLTRFGSAEELQEWFDELNTVYMRGRRSAGRAAVGSLGDSASDITNVQVRGVDEGGIVKAWGDFLVVLRRGRLFTVRIGEGSLEPVAMLDVPATPRGWSWYDEMLIVDSTVVVLGYSYSGGGTELLLFSISDDGELARGESYVLRSHDYYSSRNYATRRIGDRLLIYFPYPLLRLRTQRGESSLSFTLPSLRRQGEESQSPLIDAADIVRPVQHVDTPTLHTVLSCTLSEGELDCSAEGIIGPRSRSFYVSDDAVYIWAREPRWWRRQNSAESHDAVVYRFPHDSSEPAALRVSGAPVDQLSFQERAGHLNVLVRSSSGGDGMWSAESRGGDIALLHAPLAALGEGLAESDDGWYTSLPRVARAGFQNRFIGDFLLYGVGSGWRSPRRRAQGSVRVHHIGDTETSDVDLGHAVDRIESLGSSALVVGAGGGDLHFTTLELGQTPQVVSRYAQPRASQGETRTHGFFYHREEDDRGLLGLPVRASRTPGWMHIIRGSAGILYLSVQDDQLSPLGILQASGRRVRDRCRVSCVDWYGNSRPLFYRGRIFALLGYELVEGRLAGDELEESRRTNLYEALTE